jgi:hypothetical protein
MSQEEIEARKKKAERGWLADPPPSLPGWVVRSMKRTPEEHAAMIEAGNRRYAHLANRRRDWIADLRKNRREG